MTLSKKVASNSLPVTIVTGYLGAGKTTFINHLLQGLHDLRITVLVNDFGAVSLDESLIINRDGDVISLANGCMCCQIGGDLYRTIDRILESRSLIDLLVIETSGVADPSKIANIAIAEPDMELTSVLTLVDAVNFDKLTADSLLLDTFNRQIATASLLLLTKTEAANRDELDRLKDHLSVHAKQTIILNDTAQALNSILKMDHLAASIKIVEPKYRLDVETHKVPFQNFSWQGTIKIDRGKLIAFLNDTSLGIFRSKGTICLAEGVTANVQKVGETIEIVESKIDTVLCSIVFIGSSNTFDKKRCEQRWNKLILESDC